jgi:SAM-dependent methyltransferase
MSYQARTTCRVCESKKLENILSLGDVPLAHFTNEPFAVPLAPLELVRCIDCSLLQLKHTVDPDLMYRQYWYRGGVNKTMKTALLDVVNDAFGYLSEKQSGHSTWLDIGANDGTLLGFVPERFRRIACEPAKTFQSDLAKLKDTIVISDYFGADDVHHSSDVITSCAMFYDLDDPNRFLADIAKCLKPDGVWINQLSDTRMMLKANAFDNLCHEHLCYYEASSLKALYEKHGLYIHHVAYNDINGGSIRTIARKQPPDHELTFPPLAPQDAYDFAERVKRWKRVMISLMEGFISVWGYGASTKGNTLLHYLHEGKFLEAIADRNPRKHGLNMPGSGIRITSEEELRERRPQIVLMLPWAFKKEFIEREEQLRKDGSVLLFPLPNIELVT